jgi:hypothetical protein
MERWPPGFHGGVACFASTVRVAIPREFMLGPIFAAQPQPGGRSVIVSGRHYRIGGFHPLDPSKHPPSLDVRHARALFTILSFRSLDPRIPELRFTLREFSHRYCRSYGGIHAQGLRCLLGDLLDTYIRVQELNSTVTHSYRLIERVDIEERPVRGKRPMNLGAPTTSTWFSCIALSPEFLKLLNELGRVQLLELGALNSLRSRVAQSIYLFLPSRAYHHTSEKPFSITLSRLLEQIGHPVPPTRRLRKKLFTQRKSSILNQLHGSATLTGLLQVRLTETSDCSDYKLEAWIQATPPTVPGPDRPRGKLINAFLASGRSEADLERRLQKQQLLDPYELELLERGAVELTGNERFFTLAKALLGKDRFDPLLAEAKGDAIEKRAATKSPTARLIFRIIESVGSG